MLTGDNGILTKASGAGEKSTVGEIAEAVKLGVADIVANQMDPTYNTTEGQNVISATTLEAAIKRNNSNIGTESDADAKIKVEIGGSSDAWTVKWKNSDNKYYTWTITNKGKITQTDPT